MSTVGHDRRSVTEERRCHQFYGNRILFHVWFKYYFSWGYVVCQDRTPVRQFDYGYFICYVVAQNGNNYTRTITKTPIEISEIVSGLNMNFENVVEEICIIFSYPNH